MGTRYRYWSSDTAPPNDGVPPGLEPTQGPMFAPPFAFGGPPPFGPPPGSYGSPPGPGMVCFPTSPYLPPGPPFFPGPPPPYTSAPWGQSLPVTGPGVPTLPNEKPPPGARVNGEIAKFKNKQGHIHFKKNTMFHVCLDGSKPWLWLSGSGHRFQTYTAPSSMPIDEFIEQVGAIEKAPGVPQDQIGIQEAIEEGNGVWKPGMAFRLGDANLTYQLPDGTTAFQTLEQLGWSSQRGQAGRGKPVTIAFLP